MPVKRDAAPLGNLCLSIIFSLFCSTRPCTECRFSGPDEHAQRIVDIVVGKSSFEAFPSSHEQIMGNLVGAKVRDQSKHVPALQQWPFSSAINYRSQR